MLAGVGIVAATAATVGLLAVTVSGSQSGTRTSGSDAGVPVPPLPTKSSPVPRTPASTVDDAALPALLPDAATLAQIMGAAALTEVPDLSGPQLFTDTSDPAQCVGIAIPGARGAYAGTSWRSTYTQTLKDPAGSRSPHMVFNTVTTFPTAAAAADFTTRQLGVWQDCQGIPITTNPGDHAMTWNARDVTRGRSLTATIQPQNSDVICQRALTAVQNTVVDVQACSLDVTNEAEVITTTIAARIHP
ncbi:hypothetical protein B1R94_27635 [Mycolicibacterium litorale]|nr:hypothetical protein B1R94_27635 [Mycolicibacterium litorale]